MVSGKHIRQAFHAALPIMLGYVAIGLPCGILSNSIGLNVLQVLLLSYLFYSGAGQFMLANMYLAASPMASIIASISLVNTRQMLYAASFAPVCAPVSKPLAFFFAATVTDESFGVNTQKFAEGEWSVGRALAVNLFSESSWAISNAVGVLIGSAVNIPLNIAAFAMTAIFICLLVTQKMTSANIVAIVFAMLGVYLCKVFGLSGPAILIGALIGVAMAVIYTLVHHRGSRDRSMASSSAPQESEPGDAEDEVLIEDPQEDPANAHEAAGDLTSEEAPLPIPPLEHSSARSSGTEGIRS